MRDVRSSRPLRVAAGQFRVGGDLARNAKAIHGLVARSARLGARVVHLPETALPGYAPQHLPDLDTYPWEELESETIRIRKLAASLGIWVVLGSMRRTESFPRNCTLVISPTGAIESVYDKRRLYRTEKAIYEPGDRPCVVEINGCRCGFLICYENCFPDLYAEYASLGVELVFHSFHNAANAGPTAIENLMSAHLITRASDHRFTISASNSCAPYSPLATCVVRPDGSAVRARRNVTGLAIDDYPAKNLGWTCPDRGPGRADTPLR